MVVAGGIALVLPFDTRKRLATLTAHPKTL